MPPLDYARALRAHGLSCFPIPVGTKVPRLHWKPYQERFPTDDELMAWFSDGQPTNFGIVTGAISGVVVVDVDTYTALDWVRQHLPETPWQTDTARGRHLWFQHPGIPIPNRTHLATDAGQLPVDLRGDGGYVLAPGSRHPSGVRYRAAGDWRTPRARLPRFSSAWLQPSADHREVTSEEKRPAPLATAPTPLNDGFVLERARRYLAAIPRPEIGHGSDRAVYIAACRLVKDFALTPADAEQLLWDWCGHRAGWDRWWVNSKVESADHYGKRTIGALL